MMGYLIEDEFGAADKDPTTFGSDLMAAPAREDCIEVRERLGGEYTEERVAKRLDSYGRSGSSHFSRKSQSD